jgi:hypothetical protein
MRANVVHGADMRVAECCHGAGFPLETLAVLGVAGKVRRQHFDRDGAVETFVARAINLAHAAGPDGRENFVWSQMAAGFNWHSVTQLSLIDPPERTDRINHRLRLAIDLTDLSVFDNIVYR